MVDVNLAKKLTEDFRILSSQMATEFDDRISEAIRHGLSWVRVYRNKLNIYTVVFDELIEMYKNAGYKVTQSDTIANEYTISWDE